MQGLTISGLFGNEWEILPVVDATYSCGVDELQQFTVTLPFLWSADHEKPARIRIDNILAVEAESMEETATGCVISGNCIDYEAVNATEYQPEDLTGLTLSAICNSLSSEAGVTITGSSNTTIDRGGVEAGTAIGLLTEWADLIDKKQVTHYTNLSGDILKVGSKMTSGNTPAIMDFETSHQIEIYDTCTVTKISTVKQEKDVVVAKVLDGREDQSQTPQMTQVYKSDFINNDDWETMWNKTSFFLSCGIGAYQQTYSSSYETNDYLLAPFAYADSQEYTYEIIYTYPGVWYWTTPILCHDPAYDPNPDFSPGHIIPARDYYRYSGVGIMFKITGYRYFEPKRDQATITRIPFNIPNFKLPLPNPSGPGYLYELQGVPVKHDELPLHDVIIEYPDGYSQFVSHLTVSFPASLFVCDGFIPTKIEWSFSSQSQSNPTIPDIVYLNQLYGYTGDTIYENHNVTPPSIVHDTAWYYYWHLHRNVEWLSSPRIVTVTKDENGDDLQTPYIAFGCEVTTSKPILNEHCSTYQRYDADDARTACLGPYNDSTNHFMGHGASGGGDVKDATARNSWNCKWDAIPEVNATYTWDELSLINAEHYASIFALGMYGTQVIDLSTSNTDVSLRSAQGSTPMKVSAVTPSSETYTWGDDRAGAKPLNISSALFATKLDRTDSEARRIYYNAKDGEYESTYIVPLSAFPNWDSMFSVAFNGKIPVKMSVSITSETVTYLCQYASEGGFVIQ